MILAPILSRETLLGWHAKQVGRTERAFQDKLQTFFTKQVKSIVAELRKLAPKKNAELQAAGLLDVVFQPQQWDRELIEVAARGVGGLLWEGAVAELLAHDIAFKALQHRTRFKRTQAEEFVERYELQIPAGVDLEAPAWFVDAAQAELDEIFAQPFWLKINQTTRDDILRTMKVAVEDGLSIRQISNRILERHGASYTRARANNVARTESAGALNSGHQIGLKRIEDDLGFEVGKEWVSALSSTTREAHANLDGETVAGADGLFDLNGVLIPYPAHYSLPARDRCQ